MTEDLVVSLRICRDEFADHLFGIFLCDNLSLAGYDDWRLPSLSELRSIIDNCPGTESDGDCLLADDCKDTSFCRNDACSGCSRVDGPGYWKDGLEGQCSQWLCYYWSSTIPPDQDYTAWFIDFSYGGIDNGAKASVRCARCVRGEMQQPSDDDDNDDDTNEVWTDENTGLMWQKDSGTDTFYPWVPKIRSALIFLAFSGLS